MHKNFSLFEQWICGLNLTLGWYEGSSLAGIIALSKNVKHAQYLSDVTTRKHNMKPWGVHALSAWPIISKFRKFLTNHILEINAVKLFMALKFTFLHFFAYLFVFSNSSSISMVNKIEEVNWFISFVYLLYRLLNYETGNSGVHSLTQ